MNLEEQLKFDEGFRSKVYKCTAGYNTIGYGFNLDLNHFPEPIASALLKYCIDKTKAELIPFSWYNMQPSGIKDALVNMGFNLGIPKLLKFKNMIKALEQKDYKAAADHALDSLWARQVGDRAQRIATIIRQGL